MKKYLDNVSWGLDFLIAFCAFVTLAVLNGISLYFTNADIAANILSIFTK